jgi:cardiolipin synthase A/B
MVDDTASLKTRGMRFAMVWAALVVMLAGAALIGCQPTPAPTDTPAPATETAPPTPPPTPTPAPYLDLFVLPDAGMGPVLDALNGAQHSIHMVMYLITEPQIIQAMKDAVSRGVDTRLILEMNPYGGSSGNVDVGNDLMAAGVQVKWDNRAFNYTHEKVIVIDEEWMILLTGNMTSSTFSSNRDYGVIDVNRDDVSEALAVFEADWNRDAIDLSTARLAWAPDTSRQRMLAMFDAAQASIDLEHQSFQDEEVIAHLIAAARRGVRVRLISSPGYPLEKDTNEPGRERLRQAGGEVRYLKDPYVHAKVFVIDGVEAWVGSQNLTTNSLDFNREVGITFADPPLVARILDQFEADWEAGDVEAFPTGDLEVPATGYIDHTDASRFLYREVTVELTVTHLYNSGRVIWLMGSADQDTNFKVVIFPSVYSKWPEIPDVYYQGKTIRATGLIELYSGWPEIIVNDPEQIEIVQ